MNDKFKITIKDYLDFENTYSSQIREHLSYDVSLFENFFDIQQQLFFKHTKAKLAIKYELDENEQIIMQCYHKSINLLYIAHSLTLSGNYGGANSLLRQIFEFLIFGKYCFIIKDDKLISNWINDGYIRIVKQIFHQLTHENKIVLENFWHEVSHFTHATRSAYQLNTHFEVDYENIENTYALILLLLRCNYHLLSTCFIDDISDSVIDKFDINKGENKLLKTRAKYLVSEMEKSHTKIGKDLVSAYVAKWTTKSVLR